MEHDSDLMLTAVMKEKPDKPPKSERRRSSIFSLLQKKLTRQFSEPGLSPLKINRKYSVDSAILTDYKKNGICKEYLQKDYLQKDEEEEDAVFTDSDRG